MSLIGAIGGALSIGSTLLGLFGANKEARANEEAAQYRAAVARRNAAVATEAAAEARRRGEFDANDAIAAGIQEEARHRAQVRQLIGEQRVALAASGVNVDAGTAGQIQADSAALGALDALTIRNNAERAARQIRLSAADAAAQFEQQALTSEAEEALAERGAEAAVTAGAINVGATLLSGATQVASKWYDYNKAGGKGFFGVTF